MARTLNQVYNALIASKETKPELDELLPNPDNYTELFTQENFTLLANTVIKNLSVSLVAVWRLFLWVCAIGIWGLENLIDIFKDEVETTIKDNQYGQLRWYPTVAKQFQLGDQLVWDGTKYIYEIIDTDKQIVTQSAATESSGIITLKVAKGDLPNIEPLAVSELTSFIYYMKGTNSATANDGIIPAGVNLIIISSESDLLKFAMDLFYDPLILANDGSSLENPSENPVYDAIYDFINTLPFNSIFKVISLVDAIQAVTGIENVVVHNCDAKSAGAGSFTDVLAETGQQYTTYSGYLRMNPGNDLDEEYSPGVPTLNFIET